MSNQNPFDSDGGNLTGLPRGMVSITPSDSVDLDNVIIGLDCTGTEGDVSVVTAKGQTITYPITNSKMLVCGITRVNATGTTATGLFGFEA